MERRNTAQHDPIINKTHMAKVAASDGIPEEVQHVTAQAESN